jgi:hypothetical protein
MAQVTLKIAFNTKAAEWEFDVDAEANIDFGGSNGYGSDEPEWADVGTVSLSVEGKPIPRRMLASLTEADWDYIDTALVEAA